MKGGGGSLFQTGKAVSWENRKKQRGEIPGVLREQVSGRRGGGI